MESVVMVRATNSEAKNPELALFSNKETAHAFVNWYLSQPWRTKNLKIEEVPGSLGWVVMGGKNDERRI